MEPNATQQDLINKCFIYWNSLKRHRALSDIRKGEARREDANYHALQVYKMSEMLELTLRALQSGQRAIESEKEEQE